MASSMSSQSESQESSIWPHKHYPSFSEGHSYCGAPSSCQPRLSSPLPLLTSSYTAREAKNKQEFMSPSRLDEY